jgi:hypothetical protein
MTNAQKCYDLVKEFFKGDPKKTIAWFHEFNPGLGYLRPIEMINNRRSDKLLKFIQSSLDDNVR